jgi:hypothetical protein
MAQALMRRWLVALLLGLCLLPAGAHENLPASLLLQEGSTGVFEVRWRVPQAQGVAPEVRPVFPTDCTALTAPAEIASPGARLLQWQLRCSTGLHGATRIHFDGLALTMVDVLVRVAWRDGNHVSAIARTREPFVTLGVASAEALAPARLASGYFGLGVEHILSGIDHLLFVLCLVLLVPGMAGLLKTITAFSLAHSITLALAATNQVQLPQAPVEATIALSILFLARELARPKRADAMAYRQPWVVAFAFGLLHGFGFAGALSEVGLPQGDVPLALLLFNLGVEAGQLLFVACVLPLLWTARRIFSALRHARVGAHALAWLHAAPVYAVGAVSGFWWLQRMVPVLGLRLL